MVADHGRHRDSWSTADESMMRAVVDFCVRGLGKNMVSIARAFEKDVRARFSVC